MDFRFTPMTLADAQVVADWHYEGLYALHDWEEDPEMFGDFLRWPNLYCSVRDEGNDLVGFAQFARYQTDNDKLSAVWGLRPDLVGKEHGKAFVESCLAYARTQYKPLRFEFGVWAFNQRALHVYEQIGFRVVRVLNSETRFGLLEIIEMVGEEQDLKRAISRTSISETGTQKRIQTGDKTIPIAEQ